MVRSSFRSSFAARVPLAVSLLMCGAMGMRAAAAQVVVSDCGQNPAICDFQQNKTVLRSQIWTGDCTQPARWNSLPNDGFPIDSVNNVILQGVRAPVHFLNGTCQLLSNGDADMGIAELEKAQTTGLQPSQRNLAALFEGLLHCKKLDALYGTYGVAVTTKVSTSELFCAHRSMAKASFSDVRWTNMDVEYRGDSTSLASQIDAMGQCYGSYLSAGYDAACGLIATPSKATIDGAAATGSSPVITSYFGATDDIPAPTAGGADAGAPIAPLKAMLARKIQLADSSLSGAQANVAGLSAKNQSLTNSYQTLAAPYCNANDSPDMPCSGLIPTKVVALDQAYEASVLEAQKLIMFVDQWVNGLFQYPDSQKDVRDELRDAKNGLSDVLQGASPDATPLDQKLQQVKLTMSALSGRGAGEAQMIRGACGIYFCELRRRSKPGFLLACQQSDPVTHKQLKATNALCSNDLTQTFLTPAQTATAVSVCAAAGFSADAMDLTKTVDVAACLNEK